MLGMGTEWLGGSHLRQPMKTPEGHLSPTNYSRFPLGLPPFVISGQHRPEGNHESYEGYSPRTQQMGKNYNDPPAAGAVVSQQARSLLQELYTCLQPPRRLRVSRGHRRIYLVDFPEFACDFFIADCIEEVAENGVRVRVHVEAAFAAVLLQRLKFLNRVLLCHGVFDLRFGSN